MITCTSQSPRAPKHQTQPLGAEFLLASMFNLMACMRRQEKQPANSTPKRKRRDAHVAKFFQRWMRMWGRTVQMWRWGTLCEAPTNCATSCQWWREGWLAARSEESGMPLNQQLQMLQLQHPRLMSGHRGWNIRSPHYLHSPWGSEAGPVIQEDAQSDEEQKMKALGFEGEVIHVF